MPKDLFNVEKQLIFYGAYHSNKVNFAIHMLCVPVLIWSSQVVVATIPVPDFIPHFRHDFNSMLTFEINWPTIIACFWYGYYIVLLPSAAFIYVPQVALSLLTSSSASHRPEMFNIAMMIHLGCWLAQFYGHGVHERRSPALLDNILGAVVLAPYFVHLELLFRAGLYPELRKRVTNGIGKEIAKFKHAEKTSKSA